MLKFVNLKEGRPSVEYALSIVEMEIENGKNEGASAIKVLHGYGSHGKGGVICFELRKLLSALKKQGKIKDFFGGDDWNLFNDKTTELLNRDKDIVGDCDLNKTNGGITIIVL